MRQKLEPKEGHSFRGFMIRIYPTPDQIVSLKQLQDDTRYVWNQLVAMTESTWEARKAYARREIGPCPERPDYDGMTPDESKEARKNHKAACREWSNRVHDLTKGVPTLAYRPFSEVLNHFGYKHDYQLFKMMVGWRRDQCEADELVAIEPGAHVLQALGKDFFAKSARRKKFRRRSDSMPIRVRSGKCFQLGDFGNRRGEPFYDCQVQINGLKIRGRLPKKAPDGRVLEGLSIREEADGWWASVKVEVKDRVLPKSKPIVVGIDVGLDYIAAMSTVDGSFSARVQNCRGQRDLIQLIAARQAAELPVGRLHQRYRRRTLHDIHNLIVKPLMELSPEIIVIEILSSKLGQMGSAKTSSMLTIHRILREIFGDRVREVEPHYTSQDCSQCGHRSKESWSYEHGRIGKCVACGFELDRDLNAARNLARKYLKSVEEVAA